jgi:ArsR family transcriptional regulator
MDISTVIETMPLAQRADVFKALADPIRLEVLGILSPEICCNCHLQDRLDISPNLLSYHLKVLREAGLIEGTRRGKWIDYRLCDDVQARIRSALPPGVRP